MPKIDDMTLQDLIELRAMFVALVECGKALAQNTAAARFDLTPGQQVVIRTPFHMPGIGIERVLPQFASARPAAADLVVIKPSDVQAPAAEATSQPSSAVEPKTSKSPAADLDVKAFVDVVFAEMDAPPAVPAATGAAVEPPPAVGDSAAGGADEQAVEAEIDDALVVELRAAMEAEADPSPADDGGDPGPVEIVPTEPLPGAPWTAEEDDRLVSLVADMMAQGHSLHRAATLAAPILSRPIEGTRYRCQNKLFERISSAAGTDHAPKPAAPKPVKLDKAQVVRALAKPAAKPVPEPVAPIPAIIRAELHLAAAHIRELRPFGPWTPVLDRELIPLAEELRYPQNEIALELQVSSNQLAQRFSVLTKNKSIARKDLWAAMRAMGYGEVA